MVVKQTKLGSCLRIQEGMKYGDLFAHMLKLYGILCIGLYRFRDITATSVEQNPCAKRYVITNPPADFRLLAPDKVSVQ